MSVVLRAAIECAFLLLQYRLFGFRVPELYKCRVLKNLEIKKNNTKLIGNYFFVPNFLLTNL